MKISPTQEKVLVNALVRNGGFIFPLGIGIHAAAADSVCRALRKRGLADNLTCPMLTETGRLHAERLAARTKDSAS